MSRLRERSCPPGFGPMLAVYRFCINAEGNLSPADHRWILSRIVYSLVDQVLDYLVVLAMLAEEEYSLMAIQLVVLVLAGWKTSYFMKSAFGNIKRGKAAAAVAQAKGDLHADDADGGQADGPEDEGQTCAPAQGGERSDESGKDESDTSSIVELDHAPSAPTTAAAQDAPDGATSRTGSAQAGSAEAGSAQAGSAQSIAAQPAAACCVADRHGEGSHRAPPAEEGGGEALCVATPGLSGSTVAPDVGPCAAAAAAASAPTGVVEKKKKSRDSRRASAAAVAQESYLAFASVAGATTVEELRRKASHKGTKSSHPPSTKSSDPPSRVEQFEQQNAMLQQQQNAVLQQQQNILLQQQNAMLQQQNAMLQQQLQLMQHAAGLSPCTPTGASAGALLGVLPLGSSPGSSAGVSAFATAPGAGAVVPALGPQQLQQQTEDSRLLKEATTRLALQEQVRKTAAGTPLSKPLNTVNLWGEHTFLSIVLSPRELLYGMLEVEKMRAAWNIVMSHSSSLSGASSSGHEVQFSDKSSDAWAAFAAGELARGLFVTMPQTYIQTYLALVLFFGRPHRGDENVLGGWAASERVLVLLSIASSVLAAASASYTYEVCQLTKNGLEAPSLSEAMRSTFRRMRRVARCASARSPSHSLAQVMPATRPREPAPPVGEGDKAGPEHCVEHDHGDSIDGRLGPDDSDSCSMASSHFDAHARSAPALCRPLDLLPLGLLMVLTKALEVSARVVSVTFFLFFCRLPMWAKVAIFVSSEGYFLLGLAARKLFLQRRFRQHARAKALLEHGSLESALANGTLEPEPSKRQLCKAVLQSISITLPMYTTVHSQRYFESVFGAGVPFWLFYGYRVGVQTLALHLVLLLAAGGPGLAPADFWEPDEEAWRADIWRRGADEDGSFASLWAWLCPALMVAAHAAWFPAWTATKRGVRRWAREVHGVGSV